VTPVADKRPETVSRPSAVVEILNPVIWVGATVSACAVADIEAAATVPASATAHKELLKTRVTNILRWGK
jgi:hypothetical protein